MSIFGPRSTTNVDKSTDQQSCNLNIAETLLPTEYYASRVWFKRLLVARDATILKLHLFWYVHGACGFSHRHGPPPPPWGLGPPAPPWATAAAVGPGGRGAPEPQWATAAAAGAPALGGPGGGQGAGEARDWVGIHFGKRNRKNWTRKADRPYEAPTISH